MAPHSSTLAWKIPWTEEPGRLQSMRSLRVVHDWAISLSLFSFMRWRRKWQSTPVFLPGESQGWGSLVGLKLNIGQSHHFMANRRRKSGSSDFFFPWVPKLLWMVTAAMKDPALWKESHDKSRKWKWKSLSHIWIFVTTWSIQSMEFSRPEYCSV